MVLTAVAVVSFLAGIIASLGVVFITKGPHETCPTCGGLTWCEECGPVGHHEYQIGDRHHPGVQGMR